MMMIMFIMIDCNCRIDEERLTCEEPPLAAKVSQVTRSGDTEPSNWNDNLDDDNDDNDDAADDNVLVGTCEHRN